MDQEKAGAMKELVSIIVPVYNAERYLDRCIASILAQSYEAFELLLIDDGSKDQSGRLCDEYTRRDARIRVIHQENQGAAAARNTGLDHAQGKYVMFCDVDDVVSPMWVERLALLANENGNVQPVCASCDDAHALGQKKKLLLSEKKVYSGSRYYMFNEVGIAGYLWNTLYRRDIIESHRLRLRSRRDEGDYNEDLIFALEYAAHMEGFVYSGYADYWYDRREGSLSTSYQQLYFEKYEEKYRLWQTYIREHDCDEEDARHLATVTLYHFLQAMQMECNCADTRNMLKAYRRFKTIVFSESMAACMKLADVSRENPRIIRLIQRKKAMHLWLIHVLHRIKTNKG